MQVTRFKIATYSLATLSSILICLTGFLFWQNFQIRQEKENQKIEIIKRADDQIISQKKQKNEIADIFDTQAALNDDLIDTQRVTIRSAEEYIRLIDQSIRFIDGQPQFFPTATEEQFLNQKNQLIQRISELQRMSEENAAKKELNSDRVKQIYLQAGEDRNNTANEREGFR